MLHGGALGPDEPTSAEPAAQRQDADVAQRRDAPPAAARIGHAAPADARGHRAEADEANRRLPSPRLAPPWRSAGTANVSTASSATM